MKIYIRLLRYNMILRIDNNKKNKIIYNLQNEIKKLEEKLKDIEINNLLSKK